MQDSVNKERGLTRRSALKLLAGVTAAGGVAAADKYLSFIPDVGSSKKDPPLNLSLNNPALNSSPDIQSTITVPQSSPEALKINSTENLIEYPHVRALRIPGKETDVIFTAPAEIDEHDATYRFPINALSTRFDGDDPQRQVIWGQVEGESSPLRDFLNLKPGDTLSMDQFEQERSTDTDFSIKAQLDSVRIDITDRELTEIFKVQKDVEVHDDTTKVLLVLREKTGLAKILTFSINLSTTGDIQPMTDAAKFAGWAHSDVFSERLPVPNVSEIIINNDRIRLQEKTRLVKFTHDTEYPVPDDGSLIYDVALSREDENGKYKATVMIGGHSFYGSEKKPLGNTWDVKAGDTMTAISADGKKQLFKAQKMYISDWQELWKTVKEREGGEPTGIVTYTSFFLDRSHGGPLFLFDPREAKKRGFENLFTDEIPLEQSGKYGYIAIFWEFEKTLE